MFCTIKIKEKEVDKKLYSFEEMTKEEGIYKTFANSCSSSRFITIKNGCRYLTIFVDPEFDEIQPISESAWEDDEFLKLDEQLTISFD